jgi:serine/threonine-protein kinase RsbW
VNDGLRQEEINVKVPARPEFVHVLRLIACAVAARLDFSFDAVNDIALSVDEAFSHLLSHRARPSILKLRLSAGPGLLEINAIANITTDSWPGPRAEESLTWKVLSGLTEEAGFIHDGDEAGIKFIKRLQDSDAQR